MQPQQQEKFPVDAYSFAEALQQVQKGVQEGYVLDLESNEHYPQQWGTRFLLTMVRQEKEVVKKDVLTLKIDASEVQEVVDKALTEVKEALESAKEGVGTTDAAEAAVVGSKKPGRPAKGK